MFDLKPLKTIFSLLGYKLATKRLLADALAILGSFDLVIPEIDR